VHRAKDLYIGKKMFEVFPGEAIPKLLKLYETGDATTRGNVIRVSGNLAGPEITALLVNALDDKTFCDPEDPEVEGLPMRICDVAYNQLVLRYRIKNVLRTIGPIYRPENRDYHIAVLKGRL
jgi:HEAT repeat protein